VREIRASIPQGFVDLFMPVHGFTKPDTFCTVLTLQDAVIQGAAVHGEINERIEVTTNLAYGSGFGARAL